MQVACKMMSVLAHSAYFWRRN